MPFFGNFPYGFQLTTLRSLRVRGVAISITRINIKQGNFFEIGVCGGHKNNGTECNTIILLMLGWNGIWIDGVNIDLDLPKESKLNFFKQFLNKDNCIKTFNDALEKSKIMY